MWGAKAEEPDFPARQNFNMVVYADLVISLTKLLTDVNRDFQIKDLSLPAWRTKPPCLPEGSIRPAQGSGNRRHSQASQPAQCIWFGSQK